MQGAAGRMMAISIEPTPAPMEACSRAESSALAMASVPRGPQLQPKGCATQDALGVGTVRGRSGGGGGARAGGGGGWSRSA